MSTWTPSVGDNVRVGKGKRLWQITEIWGRDNHLATLIPLEGGYTGTTVTVDRLRQADES